MASTEVGPAAEYKEQESTLDRYWRYGAYAWTVSKNILIFWLVYLAFGKLESVFEKLMLAGVVLILVTVTDSRVSIFRTMVGEAYLHRKLFIGIYKLLDRSSVESNELELNKRIREFRGEDGFYFASQIGSCAVYLYVIWKVIQILLLS
jgi:hypothetical protein